jgi:hypothetical protein
VKPNVRVESDISEAIALGEALKRLDVELNTDRHLNSVTKSAYEILSSTFMQDTAVMANVLPELYHHVYEWEHVGHPGFELFRPVMRGRGANRVISWEWRASKMTVPTDVDALGNPKFPEWFPVEKLNRIHVFVWKAPVMEYGLETTVRPKLSRLLVMPNPERRLVLDRHPKAPRSVVFSPYAYNIDHSSQPTQGAFTKWFTHWMTEGPATRVIETHFEAPRDEIFRKSFSERVKSFIGKTGKSFSITVDPNAASRGKTVARLIAGDLERNYIAMAARRKRSAD